jgi:hypothetical protein
LAIYFFHPVSRCPIKLNWRKGFALAPLRNSLRTIVAGVLPTHRLAVPVLADPPNSGVKLARQIT